MRIAILKRYLVIVVIAILFLIGNSCDLKNPAEPSGQGGNANNPPQTGTVTNTITLVSTPGVLPADGITSSRLVATVRRKDNRVVPDMLPVTFTTTDGDLSNDGIEKLGKYYTTYTARGEAILYLISSTRDTICRVEARQGEVTAAIRIRFLRTNEDAGRIELTANPTEGSLPLIITLTATVYNQVGDTLQDAKVKFETESGFGVFKNGKSSITHITDDDGQAIAFLTVSGITGTPPDVFKIKATCGPVWDQVSIDLEQNEMPQGSLEISPSSVELAQTGQSVSVGLDATSFIDAEDGTNLTFEYSVLSNTTGCNVSIQSSAGPTTTATVTTGTATEVDGTIVFQVKVTDTQGGEGYSTAELAITIT